MRPKLTAAPPKPCPRCYAPMVKADGEWSCEKHGVPTPGSAIVPIARKRSPRPTPRGQPTGVAIYCGALLVPVLKLRGVLYCSRCEKHLSPGFAA